MRSWCPMVGGGPSSLTHSVKPTSTNSSSIGCSTSLLLAFLFTQQTLVLLVSLKVPALRLQALLGDYVFMLVLSICSLIEICFAASSCSSKLCCACGRSSTTLPECIHVWHIPTTHSCCCSNFGRFMPLPCWQIIKQVCSGSLTLTRG